MQGFTAQDEYFMRRAIELAKSGAKAGEVPVGAVLVRNDIIIGEAYNRPIMDNDPCAHAEVLALRAAAQQAGNYRLPNATLYVTLEPCTMCAGAMVHARIERLVYGAADAKAGVVISQAQVLDNTFLNHRVNHYGGLFADECGQLLSQFFKERRVNGFI